MKLYLLTQNEREGYDTYDSMVVAAKDEVMARQIHPHGEWPGPSHSHDVWASKPENVKVVLIGTAVRGTKQDIICSSFNAS